MAYERTPLLASAAVNEQRAQDEWNTSYPAMLLLPVVIVMTLNHAFHDIVPLFFPRPFLGSFSFRAAAVAVGFLSSCLSTPFWSDLGDKRGRKLVVFVSLCSALVPNLGLLLVCHFGLNDAFYLSAILLGGFLGGYTTFRGAMYAYITDLVSDGYRLGVFSIFQGFICLSYFVPDYFIRITDPLDRENVKEVAILAWPLILALWLVSFFTAFHLPESFSRQVQRSQAPIVSRMRIWFPRNLLARSSLVGLALCLYSFIAAMKETHMLKQFWWEARNGADEDVSKWLSWHDIVLKSVRYFEIIPALAFSYRPRYISPFHWDLRLVVLPPVLICGVLLVSSVLAVISIVLIPCTSFPFVICPGDALADIILWIGFIILPILCNVGGLPALYSFAAGYFQLVNNQYESGLLFGRLSILQSFSESIVLELDPFMKISSWSWIGELPLAGIAITAYLVPQLATAGLVWLSTRPRLNSM